MLLAAVLLGSAPVALAQRADMQKTVASEIVLANTAALEAFNAGKWVEAAEGFEKVITMITDPNERAQIGPIYYTLGAAYFNAKNYPKAIATFNTYVTQYPKAEHVIEARLAIARTLFLSKDFAGAQKAFEQFEAVPALRDEMLAAEAECFKQLGKIDDQIKVLEKLISPEIKSQVQAFGATTLAELYLGKNEGGKALGLINALHAHIGLVDNVVALNALTVKLGDELAERKEFAIALAAYHAVRTREEVINFQKDRITAVGKRMQDNTERAKGNPQAAMTAVNANRELEEKLIEAKTLLGEFEKLPDFWPGMLFRMARVWYDWDKKWEAIVAFDQLRKDYPSAPECESALYSSLICYADLNRVQRTLKQCDEYLEKFPTGPNAATVGYLKGACALENNDPKSAATYFGTMLQKQPTSQFREQMRFLLGNSHFVQGQFAEARESYDRYIADFPKGNLFEEATYRRALTLIFEGQYEQALAAFNAYLEKFKGGAFAADAGYRVMVCKYAGSLYDEVVADAAAWQKQFPTSEISGEVLALLGDALAAQSETAKAAAAYMRSWKVATTDEVLNYALFEANKQLQKQGKWVEMGRMFEDFVKAKPEHPTVVAAMFWIGKAKAHEGRTEEAKAFLVENLKPFLNEPKREAVEQLLQQLAQLCAKRPRPAPQPELAVVTPAAAPAVAAAATPAPAQTTGAASTPVPVATPAPLPPYDAVAELKKQLQPLTEIANDTGKARLLYAEAELLKQIKREPDARKIYEEIASKYAAETLSPVLLAVVGDHLMSTGDRAKAADFYDNLREDYPKSDYLDYAEVGLGEIALADGNAKKALELFTHAADEVAGAKAKEATIGKARAQLELGKYAEAKKGFETVASIREWRGEATALAIYQLGEVEYREGHFAEAIAYYQRVFVAYQKYTGWSAKAYLRSADCFDKLGKRQEAIGHLKELLRNEKLKDSPESKQALKQIAAWGGTA